MFHPPKGLCKVDTEGGPIVFTYVIFCIRKRILHFQFVGGFLPFGDLENVLSSEGTPDTEGGPIVFTCVILC